MMIGELTSPEIEQVLLRETIGRLGCHADGRIYVVPIAYAYDGEHVYAHSRAGMKIRAMRVNPNVCFEVDQIDDLAHWRSVVAWGSYEELRDADEGRAMAILHSRFASGERSPTSLRHPMMHGAVEQARTIYYRVRLEAKTGRFER
jgi:uncharacterized protein